MIILITFIVLVIFHHTKLYGPSDFKDESNFVKISRELQNQKLDMEVDEIVEQTDLQMKTPINEGTVEGTSFSSPKIISDIKRNYLLAEDLVFRQLEQELNIQINRHVAFKSKSLPLQHTFDGITKINDKLIAIEVKYTKTNKIMGSMLKSLLDTINSIDNLSLEGFKLIVVIVSDEGSIENKEFLESRIKQFNINVDIRYFDFKELKIKYGIE